MLPSLAIYYATMTGNAEELARRTAARAGASGWHPVLLNLSEVRPDDLRQHRLALFIVSTWGDGEPPANAGDFWRDLETIPWDLAGLTYAVFGLGDRGYAAFNAFARQLDERLTQLGAGRLHRRVEADLDFDDAHGTWEDRIFGLLASPLEALS
jgi:sulfite reductase (NADPH) flavoprotein alpha-component